MACSLRVVFVTAILAGPTSALAERRHALIIAANTGWAMDRPLRHAHDDAAHMAAVLEELGGFEASDVTVPRVMMLVVVPAKEVTTEAACVLNAAEPSRKVRTVLERLEV